LKQMQEQTRRKLKKVQDRLENITDDIDEILGHKTFKWYVLF